MVEHHTFLFLDPALQADLSSKDIDISDVLRKMQQSPTLTSGTDPGADTAHKTKEPAAILLASAAVVAAATPALKALLEAITRKPVLVKEVVCTPLEDSRGNIVRDAGGEPKLVWLERSKILEGRAQTGKQDVKISGYGIRVEYKDAQGAR